MLNKNIQKMKIMIKDNTDIPETKIVEDALNKK